MRLKEKISKEQESLIRNYYRQATDLFLPNKNKWRFFCMVLPNGMFKRFNGIDNIEKLKKLLIKYAPQKVYFSAGACVNIQNVRGRVKTSSHPILVFEDIIFDIDADNLKEAKESALEVIKRIGEPSKIVQAVRGYHLWYEKQGKNKEKYIKLVENIKNVDIKCTKDPYHIFALPKTIKKGQICDFISYDTLKNSTISPESTIHYLYDHRDTSEKPLQANETGLSPNSRSKRQKKGIEPEETILSFHNLVTSKKSKLYIPILLYDRNLKNLKGEINYLAKHYNLGNLYIFHNKDYLVFISLKVMDKRRLMKALSSSRSKTRNQFLKYEKIYFDISKYKFYGVLNYAVNNFFRASNKHYKFLVDCGIKVNQNINELVGQAPLQFKHFKILN